MSGPEYRGRPGLVGDVAQDTEGTFPVDVFLFDRKLKTISFRDNWTLEGATGADPILYALPLCSEFSWPGPINTLPDGFVPEDGRLLLVEDYPDAFAILGSTYGGDGVTTFAVPDARGLVVRGTGTQGGGVKKANGDAYEGPGLGVVEGDQMQQITGSSSNAGSTGLVTSGAVTSGALKASATSRGNQLTTVVNTSYDLEFDSANSPGARTGDETRAASTGRHWVIKVRHAQRETVTDTANVDARLTALENISWVAEKFDTGWIAKSAWTSTTFTITHNLTAHVADLIVEFWVSSDSAGVNAMRIPIGADYYESVVGQHRGLGIGQIDTNAFQLGTPSGGMQLIDKAGYAGATLTTQAWFYRIVVYKPSALTYIGAVAPPVKPMQALVEERVAGVAGTFTAGSWVTRALTTVVYSDIVGLVLAGSQITLPAGTYEITGSAPGHQVRYHQTRLYDVTNSIALLYGTNMYSLNGTGGDPTLSVVDGRITLNAETVIRLEHYANTTKTTDGLGPAELVGPYCVFARIKITKLSN